jgi:hypothetical protein
MKNDGAYNQTQLMHSAVMKSQSITQRLVQVLFNHLHYITPAAALFYTAKQ